MVAAAIIGGSALAAGSSLLGSSQAAGGSKAAAGTQKQMYYQTRSDLMPYSTIGQTAAGNALDLAQSGPTGGGPDYVGMASQNLPGMMTEAQLEQTPGYQFTRDQGLKAVQSSAAARGLGVSGESLKGAATYATGLADSTYSNRFNEAQQRFTDYLNLNVGQQGNLTNQFNRYNALAGLGESAAAQTGSAGTAAANAAGNYINQGGLAQAAGTTGVGSAITSGVNSYLGYNALQQALNPTTTGGFGTPLSAASSPGSTATWYGQT